MWTSTTEDGYVLPTLIKIIPVALLFAGIAYMKWRLSPPDEVIGTYLEDNEARTRQLIKASREQHYKERWCRSDPD